MRTDGPVAVARLSGPRPCEPRRVNAIIRHPTVTLQEGHAHCLLVVCDELSPPSLTEARPVPASFAAALLLAHKDQAGTPIRAGWQPCRDAAVSGCRGERLESMRRSNPAARSLPLLGAIASEGDRELRLSWCEGELALRCCATKGG